MRREHIRNSRKQLEKVFRDDPAFTPFVYKWRLNVFDKENYIDDNPIPIRLYDRKFSNANGWMVEFQTPFEFRIDSGDILYDSTMDYYYICTESFNLDNIHWHGRLGLCNWRLKWQKQDGSILEYPCMDQNATQYNSGETANRQFTIGTSQHLLTLPLDENTAILKTPQRFFLDHNRITPTPFIITQNDTTSFAYGRKGVIKITVFEDVIRPDADRIDLMICDYIDPDSTAVDNSDGETIAKSVIAYDTKTIRSGGDVQKFVGYFYDGNGNLVSGATPRWSILCDFVNELEVSETDNVIWIKVDNDNLVDEEFRLILTDDNGQNESSLLVRVGSLLNG